MDTFLSGCRVALLKRMYIPQSYWQAYQLLLVQRHKATRAAYQTVLPPAPISPAPSTTVSFGFVRRGQSPQKAIRSRDQQAGS